MVLNTIDEEDSLIQGGAYIGFMIHHLIEDSEDVIELNFFKVIQLF